MGITPDERRYKAANDREKFKKQQAAQKRKQQKAAAAARKAQEARDDAERTNGVGSNLDALSPQQQQQSAQNKAKKHSKKKQQQAQQDIEKGPLVQQTPRDGTLVGRINVQRWLAIVGFLDQASPTSELNIVGVIASNYIGAAANLDALGFGGGGNQAAAEADVAQWTAARATLPDMGIDGQNVFKEFKQREHE